MPTSGACDPHTAHSYSSNSTSSSTSSYTICNTGHTCLLTTGASSADHGSVLGAEAPRVSHPLWPNHQLPVCQSTVGQTHLKHDRANTQTLQTQGAASSYLCVTSRRIIRQAQNYYSTHQRANTQQMHKSIKEDGLVNKEYISHVSKFIRSFWGCLLICQTLDLQGLPMPLKGTCLRNDWG